MLCRALQLGYESPIHNNKADTDNCYDANMNLIVNGISEGKGCELVVASHNQSSVEQTIRFCQQNNVEEGIYFGQLV